MKTSPQNIGTVSAYIYIIYFQYLHQSVLRKKMTPSHKSDPFTSPVGLLTCNAQAVKVCDKLSQ